MKVKALRLFRGRLANVTSVVELPEKHRGPEPGRFTVGRTDLLSTHGKLLQDRLKMNGEFRAFLSPGQYERERRCESSHPLGGQASGLLRAIKGY